jgi:hypothetical protein
VRSYGHASALRNNIERYPSGSQGVKAAPTGGAAGHTIVHVDGVFALTTEG